MRLIDADEVKRFYETYFKDLDNGVHWSRNDIIMNLDCIETADIVPVIRCRNCKHFDRNEESRKEGGMFNICGEGRGMFLNENDFCSSAERKEK